MNNALTMTDPFEARKNTQATLITAGFAAFMLLLMFLLKWELPIIPIPDKDEGILVELNLPEDPPAKVLGGGGGGGNPVQATGEKGTASSPPTPGEKEDVKDIEESDEKESPPIKKPDNPKPEAKAIDNNKSEVKTVPKVIENPAPAKPKAVLGKTVGGNSNGGGTAENYDRSGGAGKGNGVGTGNGNGGGTGNGTGGGNGTGSGTGNGPRRVSGSRIVINPKAMNAGENLKGKVLAEIRVSPDGIGTFLRTMKGSTYTSGPAIDILRQWLRTNRFNKTDEESTVVYEFNFLLGG